jgi:hypothetical protein
MDVDIGGLPLVARRPIAAGFSRPRDMGCSNRARASARAKSVRFRAQSAARADRFFNGSLSRSVRLALLAAERGAERRVPARHASPYRKTDASPSTPDFTADPADTAPRTGSRRIPVGSARSHPDIRSGRAALKRRNRQLWERLVAETGQVPLPLPPGKRAASPPLARPGLPDHLRPIPPPLWCNSRPIIPLPLGGYLACPARLWHGWWVN